MGDVLNPLLGALATAFAGILAAWLFARVRSGRLARTLDQTSKLLDFVERYCAAYESLAKVTEAKRDDVESILVQRRASRPRGFGGRAGSVAGIREKERDASQRLVVALA